MHLIVPITAMLVAAVCVCCYGSLRYADGFIAAAAGDE